MTTRSARHAILSETATFDSKAKQWQRNDRLIAVATHAQTHENVKSLEGLRPTGLPEFL
jgi:hypothetical protein